MYDPATVPIGCKIEVDVGELAGDWDGDFDGDSV